MQELDVRYTKLQNGHWIIEATSQVPLSVIRQTMQFVGPDHKKYNVVNLITPEGSPDAPYYYCVEAEVEG